MRYAFLIFLFASIVVALRRGGPPEKWGAMTLALMAALQIVGIGALGSRFGRIDWVAFVVDLLGFCSFTAIALFARRIWPLWASALQLFSLTTHFIRLVDMHIHPAVYWLMKSAPTFGVCLLLIGATLLGQRHQKSSFEGACWKDWRANKRRLPSTRTTRRS